MFMEALSPILRAQKNQVTKNKECVHKCTLDWNLKMNTSKAWHNKFRIQKKVVQQTIKSQISKI
jgi:hypothetical protein